MMQREVSVTPVIWARAAAIEARGTGQLIKSEHPV